MSEPRIALVAEGPTDLVIIEAALKAIIGRAFIINQLQPEETNPKIGTGWTGVLKWCLQAGQRHPHNLDTDPTLDIFDILIIHLDVDVASKSYADAGYEIEKLSIDKNWGKLPCARPCPNVFDSVVSLTEVLDSWLIPASRGGKAVLCLPAQASGTWLAAATLPDKHFLLTDIECNLTVEDKLSRLPKKLRINKSKREYQNKSKEIIENWEKIKSLCSCATEFENLISETIN